MHGGAWHTGAAASLSRKGASVLMSGAPACVSGCCSEAERDRIEEQVGLFVRTCNSNIVRLEASVQQQQEQQQGRQPGTAQAINPHVTAHRHGIVRVTRTLPAWHNAMAVQSSKDFARVPPPSQHLPFCHGGSAATEHDCEGGVQGE